MNVLTSTDLSADGAPLLRTGAGDDEEFLLASFTNVEIHASASDMGEDDDGETQTLAHSGSVGALFVTTSRVIWLGAAVGTHVGYAWEMSSVTLHAISRDPAAFPKPCLYCQISNQDVSEVRFVPTDDKTLQEVFDAFSKSAEMNPDDDEEDDDGWICDEDEVADGLEQLNWLRTSTRCCRCPQDWKPVQRKQDSLTTQMRTIYSK
ncbi:Pepsin A [Phytophthora nicotianae]|uniref:Pepsin A n=1 Tax=Phytophthora nicotianae TaxID=4792 RepID=A0A0W8CML0_PHYNI|nr:Pepsin A [Phytophthora nicotianae]